jgi:hypothetical protein
MHLFNGTHPGRGYENTSRVQKFTVHVDDGKFLLDNSHEDFRQDHDKSGEIGAKEKRRDEDYNHRPDCPADLTP